jgi:ElaB/YqjD/DUF883 family membrane-anchored ribosome-binding protein
LINIEDAMARNSRNSWSATSREIGEIGELLRQLEGRLQRLGGSAVADARGAGSAIPEMISETLSDLTERLRAVVHDRAHDVGTQAARAGSDAWRKVVGSDTWHKVEDEVSHRPLATLAVVAGIGFLVGVLGRRH